MSLSNQTYGSISNVCSSKKQSFISTCCTPLKLCIILFSLLSLILLSLFVSGVIYVNLKDGIRINGFNNKLISHSYSHSHLQNYVNGINDNIDLDECQDSDYMWTYTFWSPNNKQKYQYRYWCYLDEEECLECFDEFEENDACYEEEDDSHTGCYGDCTVSDEAETRYGETLYCFYTVEDIYNTSCFSWDSIVTKVIIDDGNNNNNDIIITQDVMINDIKLGDYVITGINGEYSKVIDRSHFNVYEKSTEKTSMIEICFDTDSIYGDLEESVLYNCIKMTGKHLIYVNGIDLESLDRAENVQIGDYLYHTGLKQFVVVNKINRGINDYFRNIMTEDGNIIINNGFFASTVAEGGFFKNDSPNRKPHESHVNMVIIFNGFYKIFTLNGIYEGLWESELFDYILRIPTKNAIAVYTGYPSILSKKYQYSMVFLIFTQCTVSVFLYLFIKRVMHIFDNKKSV